MVGTFPNNLEMLHGRRQALSKEERIILDFIWAYYVKNGERLQERVLFQKFPELVETQFGWVTRNGPRNPWSSLKSTPPPYLVDKFTMGEFSGINPTLLGTLLSNQGERLESKLAKYLKWICGKAKSNKNFNMVTAKDLVKALRIKESETFEISRLVVLAGFAPEPKSKQTPKNWELSLPLDMKRVLKAEDLQMFVAGRALGETLVPHPAPKGWEKFSTIEALRYVINGGGQPYFDEEEQEQEDALDVPVERAAQIQEKGAAIPDPKEIAVSFGERVRTARENLGWTRLMLSLKVKEEFQNSKLSEDAIKLIENGTSKKPRGTTIAKLRAVMPSLFETIPNSL